MKNLKRLCKVLYGIFVSSILAIFLIYIFQIKILKKNYANIFNCSVFHIETGSMLPTINIGDEIIVNLTKNVKEGDVIVYEDEYKNIVCHRLVQKCGKVLITKGDNNNSEDDPINIEQVIGKVIQNIPMLGSIQKKLKNSKIFILIIILIAISVIIPNKFYKKLFKRKYL